MTRRLGTLLLLALFSLAAAQCSVPAGSQLDTLTLEGFGTAYFQNLRFDSERDLAEFYGGVCIAGAGWALLTERVLLTGLRGDLQLSAAAPELRVPELVLTGSELIATEETLTMTDVALIGPELSGTATSLELDLASNVMTLTSPALRGTTLLVLGDHAVIDGNQLTIDRAIVTTCLCGDTPLYTVRGDRVAIDLAGEVVRVAGGSVHLGILTVQLGDELEIDTRDLEGLEIPFAVVYDADRPDEPGTGLGIEISEIELARGVRLAVDIGGLDPAHPLAGSALLSGRVRGVRYEVGMIDGGVSSEIVVREQLLPWLDAAFVVRNFDRPAEHRLHEGVLSLIGSGPLPLPAALGELALEGRLFAAASAQARPAAEVSGPRLGARVDLLYQTPATPVGRGAIDTRLSASLYPETNASQLAFRVAPAWSATVGPLSLGFGLERQWSDAGSPFSVRLDREEPLGRAHADIELAVTAGDLGGALSFEVAHDLLVGSVSRLRAGGLLSYAPGPDRVLFRVDSDLLGLIGSGDAWIETGLGWRRAIGGGAAELTLALRSDLAPAALSWLDVSAAYPLQGDGALLTPFLAVDLLPLLSGLPPAISGHGIDLVWYTCCGTLLLGYRSDRDGFSSSVGVQLGGAGTAPEGEGR